MRYEIIYLIGASEEANLEQIKKSVEKIIIDFSGVFEKEEWTEKRRLAYQIGKDFQGTYIAKRFELTKKENIVKINKQLNLLSSILRFMISKTDNLPEFEEMTKKEEKRKENEKENSPKKELREEKKEDKKTKEKNPNTEKEEKNEDIDKKLEEILNI